MKSILFNQENEVYKNYTFEGGTRSDAIEGLSQINIFIGANNSGKSRLLREIFTSFNSLNSNSKTSISLNSDKKFLEKWSKRIDTIQSNQNFLQLHENILNHCKNSIIPEIRRIESILDNDEIIFFRKDGLIIEAIGNLIRTVSMLSKTTSFIYEEFITFVKDIDKYFIYPKDFHSIYTPILRTLRKIKGDELIKVTKKEYFNEFDVKIFTGENFYTQIGDLQEALEKDLIRKEKFEKHLSTTFFNNKKVRLRRAIIREENKNEKDLFIKIGNENEFPIYQLGDGIQSIIILTYQLFLHEDEDFILFIEEPEQNLHPGMQRIFLETITQFPKAKVFFTTHSNHFLDMSSDFRDKISIYSFKKEVQDNIPNQTATFKVRNITNPDFNLLNELGVRNSSVFLANCTIWVEGITDRFYIRKYLKLYQEDLRKQNPKAKLYQEDLHFSFIEYGGNNITHWSFLDDSIEGEDYSNIKVEAISGNIFLIADNDGADDDGSNKTAKAERFKQLEAVLGDRFYPLKAREIENLIIPDVLVKALIKLDKINKIKDWSVFDNVKHEDYQNEKIGEFIDDTTGISRFKDKSGTIKQKTEFAIASTEEMSSMEDLSQEAKQLTKRIYKFIEVHNL